MNKFILAAAVLSALTLLLHVFGGAPQYLVPAWASDMSADQKTLYSVLWHTITALLGINATALVFAARSARPTPLVLLVSAQYMAMAVLFFVLGLAHLGTLWVQPQWVIFSAISALAILGLRGAHKSLKNSTAL